MKTEKSTFLFPRLKSWAKIRILTHDFSRGKTKILTAFTIFFLLFFATTTANAQELPSNVSQSGSFDYSFANQIAFSSDGKWILVGEGYDIKLYSALTKNCVRIFSAEYYVTVVCFTSDAKHFVSGSRNGYVKLWNTSSGRCLKTYNIGGDVVDVRFSPDNRYILAKRYNSGFCFLETEETEMFLPKCVPVKCSFPSVVPTPTLNNEPTRQEKKIVITIKIDSNVVRGFTKVDEVEVLNSTSKILFKGTAKSQNKIKISEVKVDGKKARLSANGDFGMDLFLGVGENKLSVTATDVEGNTSSQTFTINRLEADADIPQNVGKYYALLIGVSEYTNSQIGQFARERR